MTEAYIALGSNIGDRKVNIKKALQFLTEKLKILQVSALYENKPMYIENQGMFLNGVVKVETDLAPQKLLRFFKDIEQRMGRVCVERNGPRIIDLDILFYGQQVIDEDGLKVPHPKIEERDFVLVPLTEIAPNLMHPIHKKTISKLLSELKYNPSEISVNVKADDLMGELL
ncbi:MAG: 2-amino-4-hydroxy-6-hydroxymethyldihydropteridine diphosphokinase [Candidatus Bathyarchaeota archaeon]|nr:2-amino-4-hydroxy-6-hydroxymethyldihydropteridine diphosphokinase [Candidatus Bathyarchaeota archaeon]